MKITRKAYQKIRYNELEQQTTQQRKTTRRDENKQENTDEQARKRTRLNPGIMIDHTEGKQDPKEKEPQEKDNTMKKPHTITCHKTQK